MKPTLLFVHSPVVGPSTWVGVAEVLRRRGFRCAVPDLRPALAQGPPFYPRLAAAAARTVTGGGAAVLIAHSAAGPLLPAIGEAVAAPVRGVFVDAQLPHPGRSWFDAAPAALREQMLAMVDGTVLPPWHEWLPPGVLDEVIPDAALRRRFVAELPRVPVAYFAEAAPVTRRLGKRWAYLRFSAGYDDAAADAATRNWWVARRDWDHLRMVSAPEAVAELLLQAITATAS